MVTPPPYALLEVVGVCQLAQVYPRRADSVLTVCLACGLPFGDAEEACICTSALRSQAVAILHAELVAGRDPEPALKRWRAETLPRPNVLKSQPVRADGEVIS